MSEKAIARCARLCYEVIRQRHGQGLTPLTNAELAQAVGYSQQFIVVRSIPLMQMAADADGLYLGRPHVTNGYTLTLTDQPELPMLAEISRDRHRATRQANNVRGRLLDALAAHPEPTISQTARDILAFDKVAQQVDLAREGKLADLASSLRERIADG